MLSEQFYKHKNSIIIIVICISLVCVQTVFVKTYVTNYGKMYSAGKGGGGLSSHSANTLPLQDIGLGKV